MRSPPHSSLPGAVGGVGRWGGWTSRRRGTQPFSSWATDALVHHPLLGQPRERGSPGVRGSRGSGEAGQGGQRGAGHQSSRTRHSNCGQDQASPRAPGSVPRGAGRGVALAPGMGSSGLNSKGLSMKAAMTKAEAWPEGLAASSV